MSSEFDQPIFEPSEWPVGLNNGQESESNGYSYSEEELRILREIDSDLNRQGLAFKFKINGTYRRFMSYSGGRGKRRQSPRDVELVRIGKRFHLVKDDWVDGLDDLANEMLAGIITPNDYLPSEYFLHLLRVLAK